MAYNHTGSVPITAHVHVIQDEIEMAAEFTRLFLSMIYRSTNRIDQFLTVSDIPLEGTDNASIVRPQAKRKMSSNPSSNIFFCHSSSPEVDCCPGPGKIVDCPEVGSSLSFLATTSTFYT